MIPPRGTEMTTFDRIKNISKKKGYSSLRVLSETAGLGPNAIYQWRNKTPRTDNLQAVADVLGVSVDYLLGNTDDMHANKKSTDNEPVDIKKVAENDTWDDYLSSDGRPLTEHDKKLLRAIFGD